MDQLYRQYYGMTVREILEVLEDLPPETPVMVSYQIKEYSYTDAMTKELSTRPVKGVFFYQGRVIFNLGRVYKLPAIQWTEWAEKMFKRIRGRGGCKEGSRTAVYRILEAGGTEEQVPTHLKRLLLQYKGWVRNHSFPEQWPKIYRPVLFDNPTTYEQDNWEKRKQHAKKERMELEE